jgi:zinc transport system ATP-binding protein
MDTRSSNLLQLKNAGVQREGRWLVRGVSLTISPGEIITLIGPNGSGKSTTAKLALGIHPPDEGGVIQRPGLRVAYVPQKIDIDWTLPLTVDRLMRLTGKVSNAEALDALEATGTASLINSQVRGLSGGELQRVLLARAMVRKPDLMVLDEPVQSVDLPGEIELYKLIGEMRDRLGCGILLISHDLHVVMAATDRVICLNGHVCCEGTPLSVSQSDAYKKLFGDRGMAETDATLAVYQHHHDHTHLPDGRVQHADGSITDHCHPDDGGHGHPADHRNGRNSRKPDHAG